MLRIVSCSFAFALLVSVVTGCSSEAPSADGSSTPKVAEPITVQASAQTKRDLGVFVWGASGEDRNLHLTGYDANGEAAFVVDQRVVMIDDTHNAFDTTLAGREQAHMRLDATMTEVDDTGHFQIALETTDNTFIASPLAIHVLEQIQNDLGQADAAQPTTTVGSGSLVSTKDVKVQDGQQLVTGCSGLVKQCGSNLVAAAKPLVPCAMAVVQAGSILLCGVAGFFAGGPIGALEAGAVCGIRQQGAVVSNALKCADNASGIYNDFSANKNAISQSCGGAMTSCNPGGDVPMMSVKPSL